MKKYILHFIKLSLALILLLQVGEVSAQTIPATNTSAVGQGIVPIGWTLLQGSTDISNKNAWAGVAYYAWSVDNPPNGHTVWVNGFSNETAGTTITGLTVGKKYNFTFYVAELQNLAAGSINNTYDGIFEVVSYAGTSGSYTYTSMATYPFSGGASSAWSQKTFTFTATATTFNIAFRYLNAAAPSNGNFWNISFDSNTIALCNAGAAPTLSATTINNSSCASGYINLNSLVTSTLPTGTSLKWYTSTARTTEVIDPTGVTASGTYYGYYYDATNNCYSGASAAVTATYTVCPLNLATVCPAVSVDLASRVTDTAPSGYTYTYHSGTPATTANKLSSSVVSTAGTYYVATYFAGQDCYTNTSRPMVVTITNCCATLAAPTWN
jgi:hypothetical protein